MLSVFKKDRESSRTLDNERINCLRLIRSENVGIKTFYTLLKLYGTATEAIKVLPQLAQNGGRKKPIHICNISDVEKEIENCNKIDAHILFIMDEEYPRLLKEIDDAPPVITVLGNINLLNTKQISIVGARNASANGCKFAQKLACDLGKEGITISSGLARGIDTAAHNGALSTGTIAVIAGGIDNIYPPENKELYHKIAESGAIIAELPFGTIPRAQNFPQRNRIISGLSYGTVVVEASFASGSLITARCALNQNREVFAVPGSPLDPRCQGTNNLIKQGAKLTESANDIIEEIKNTKLGKYSELNEKITFMQVKMHKASEEELKDARISIKALLSPTPINIDEIIKISGFSIPVVLTVILELELANKIDRHPGNKISLIYDV